MYVGAKVSTGSLIVNYLELPNIAQMDSHTASYYLAYFWGSAMVGRFIGFYLLTKLPHNLTLGLYAIINCILLTSVIINSGAPAMWSILAIGFFNSIMFTIIYSLGISSFKDPTTKNTAGGFLIVAIVSGAIIPIAQGFLDDTYGLQNFFCLLIICYIFIAIFASSFAFINHKNQNATWWPFTVTLSFFSKYIANTHTLYYISAYK